MSLFFVKKLVRQVINKLGFQIARIPQVSASNDAYLVMQHLCQRIPEPIIFDVGAHQGLVSLLLSRLLPNARIFAFEPFPESFAKLQANTRDNPQIHCFNYGLSDVEGDLKFHSNPSSETNSLYSTDEAGPTTWGGGLLETTSVIDAQFKTLDEVIRELNLPRIDLLKLDVQGAEHLVLKGAEESCAGGLIQLVYSEIITQPTYKGQLRFDEALAAFYDRGFDLYHFFELSRNDNGYLRQLDALFIRKTAMF